jgi:hypothetical protein
MWRYDGGITTKYYKNCKKNLLYTTINKGLKFDESFWVEIFSTMCFSHG